MSQTNNYEQLLDGGEQDLLRHCLDRVDSGVTNLDSSIASQFPEPKRPDPITAQLEQLQAAQTTPLVSESQSPLSDLEALRRHANLLAQPGQGTTDVKEAA